VELRRTILYVIEVMMLVTALIRPVPLALSLFPVGTKPIMTWLTSFLSLGFCKICFSLFSGLSSLAIVYSGPENVNMLVAAIVLGLLAPVLSFTVASGAGIGALSTISISGQGIGINSGVSLYYPGTGGRGSNSNNPNTNRVD
jgi:ABC-type transport system involved in cytochrome c biogenesis permease component